MFPTDHGEAIGHGGALEGYTSEMFHYPDEDTTIVAFTNTSAGSFDAAVDPEDVFFDFIAAVEGLAL